MPTPQEVEEAATVFVQRSLDATAPFDVNDSMERSRAGDIQREALAALEVLLDAAHHLNRDLTPFTNYRAHPTEANCTTAWSLAVELQEWARAVQEREPIGPPPSAAEKSMQEIRRGLIQSLEAIKELANVDDDEEFRRLLCNEQRRVMDLYAVAVRRGHLERIGEGYDGKPYLVAWQMMTLALEKVDLTIPKQEIDGGVSMADPKGRWGLHPIAVINSLVRRLVPAPHPVVTEGRQDPALLPNSRDPIIEPTYAPPGAAAAWLSPGEPVVNASKFMERIRAKAGTLLRTKDFGNWMGYHTGDLTTLKKLIGRKKGAADNWEPTATEMQGVNTRKAEIDQEKMPRRDAD